MKLNKIATTYSLATQGIFSMVCFMGLGFFIGYCIDKESAWPAILAVVGVLLGLFTFVSYLLYLISIDEKERKKGKIDDSNEKKD